MAGRRNVFGCLVKPATPRLCDGFDTDIGSVGSEDLASGCGFQVRDEIINIVPVNRSYTGITVVHNRPTSTASVDDLRIE
jgi:hypothetical protein